MNDENNYRVEDQAAVHEGRPTDVRGYVLPEEEALFTLPTPIDEMSVPALNEHLARLTKAYTTARKRIVEQVEITNLAHHVDRVTTAEHHLRPLVQLKREIEAHLADRPKVEPTAKR